ncbi:MAG: inovirus-type Gp2 protein [Moraxellaceae bacterium]|nr:inovirus-type Gp2 protein [Moraxellaceae bacterium]
MLKHHCRVVVIRFDLHQQHYTPNNSHLNDYFRNVVRKAKRKYNLSRVGYGWVREVERVKNQHYHCFIILDGNKVKNGYRFLDEVRSDWLFRTDSSFFIPDNPIHFITRDNERETSEAVYRLSYLAKERGKGYKATNARDYSTSRLKN